MLYFPNENVLSYPSFFSCFLHPVVHSAQDPHVHGLSYLKIAIENQTLLVEINSPLMDIVGFEGEPRTKVQKDSIELATNKLRTIGNVLIFKGGSCVEKKIDVNLGHGHGTEHSHSEHDRGTHSEISAVYKFNCLSPRNCKKLQYYFRTNSLVWKNKSSVDNPDSQGQITLDKNKISLILDEHFTMK